MDASTEHRTPADAINNRQELRPLPLRVASSQYQRLDAARTRTGISIQEHVRRAIDFYLAVVEREAIDLGLMPDRMAAGAARSPALNPLGATKRPLAMPKVRKR